MNTATFPLSMMVVGGGLKLRFFVDSNRIMHTLCASGIKLMISPLIAWGICLALGLTRDQLAVCVLQSAMPAAVLVTIFSVKYEADPVFSNAIVSLTTLAGMGTIPVLLFLLKGSPRSFTHGIFFPPSPLFELFLERMFCPPFQGRTALDLLHLFLEVGKPFGQLFPLFNSAITEAPEFIKLLMLGVAYPLADDDPVPFPRLNVGRELQNTARAARADAAGDDFDIRIGMDKARKGSFELRTDIFDRLPHDLDQFRSSTPNLSLRAS